MLRAAMRLPEGKGSAIFDFSAVIPLAEGKRFRENLKARIEVPAGCFYGSPPVLQERR